MNKISKGTCIFIGVLLWGLPIGILISLLLACVSFSSNIEIQGFEFGPFFVRAIVIVPVFSFLGIFVGLFLYNKWSKYLGK